MKIILITILLVSSLAASADVTFECSLGDYKVNIGTAQLGGRGNGGISMPIATLYKSQKFIGEQNLRLVTEGQDEFLNAYVWEFESTDGNSVIGVGSVKYKPESLGNYKGSADLHIEVSGETFSGSTVPCVITVK